MADTNTLARLTDTEKLRECSFCGDPIIEQELFFQCPACQALYHPDCWRFSGSECSRLGCPGIWISADEELGASAQSALRIRLRESDLTDTPGSSTTGNNRPGNLAAPRKYPLVAILLSAIKGILLAGLLRALVGLLRLGPTEAIYFENFFRLVVSVSEVGVLWWALIGGLYGREHFLFLHGVRVQIYRKIRLVGSLCFLPVLGHLIGHLLMISTLIGENWLWGVLSKIQWIAPFIIGLYVLHGLLAAIGFGVKAFSLFEIVFGWVLFLATISILALLGALLNGVFGGLLFGFVGYITDVIVGSAGRGVRWSEVGKLLGAFAGFSTVFLSVFREHIAVAQGARS